ncbi:hypothetical protein GOV05_05770, partial [Candidatus Woesearchaeota archaeon]|nr:hypothetical protein [Candidatus Woesearchaeota archaeon]
MGSEFILSEANIKKKTLHARLRAIKTGEDLSDTYVLWDHRFVIWPQPRWGVKDNLTITRYLKRLEEELRKDSEFAKYEIKRIDSHTPSLQIMLPINYKEKLEKKIGQIGFHHDERRVIKDVKVPPEYASVVRWDYAERGDIVRVDEGVLEALRQKKVIEEKIVGLERRIEEELSGLSKGVVTRHKNEMHKIFEAYNGRNYDEIRKKLEEGTFSSRLSRYWDVEKEILDEVFHSSLNMKSLGTHSKMRFYDRNERLKSSTKNYGLDMLIDSINMIPKVRKMTADEWRAQKWLFLDIEKPQFNSPDEEVSWVGFDYWQDCEPILREIHTLRDLGVEVFEGSNIYTYSDIDEMLGGMKKSVKKENPFVASAFNAKFDFTELRGAGDFEDFGIGVEEDDPRYIVSLSFFERMGLRGKVVFDMFNFARIIEGHLPNRKLDLVTRHVHGDESVGKDLNYAQLRELEKIAIDGIVRNRREDVILMIEEKMEKRVEEMSELERKWGSARVQGSYLNKDLGAPTNAFFRHEWGIDNFDWLCELSEKFGVGIERFITHNNVKDVLERLYFDNVGVFYDHVYVRSKKRVLAEQKATAKFKSIRRSLLDAKDVKGLHSDVHHVYIPLTTKFLDVLSDARPVNKEYFDRFPKSFSSLEEKYFYTGFLGALLREPGFNYASFVKTKPTSFDEISKRARLLGNFRGKFGIFPNEFGDVLEETYKEVNSFIRENELEVVFRGASYAYLVGDRRVLEDVEAPVVLVDSIDNVLVADNLYYKKHGYYRGVVVKDHPTKFVSMFEMGLYKDIVDLILDGRV